jgi:hypothetical protein
VLCPAGGVLLLLAALFGFSRLMHKRDIKHAQASLGVAKGAYDPGHSTPTSQRSPGLSGWLFGLPSDSSSGEGVVTSVVLLLLLLSHVPVNAVLGSWRVLLVEQWLPAQRL